MPNLFQRLFPKIAERRSQVYTGDTGFFAGLMGRPTASGANVDESNALSITSVYSCVSKIAQTIAGLPLNIYSENEGRITKVDSHPLNFIVGVKPDDDTTAFQFWETMFASALLTGVGYAIIRRDTMSGHVSALNFVPSHKVSPKRFDGASVYEVKDIGTILSDDIIRITAPFAKSPIALHRETLGLAVAAQEYGQEFFGNSGTPVGVLTTEQPLTQDQMNIVAKSWAEAGETLGTKVIPFGFKYQKISASPEDMQFIETRNLQDRKIAELYGVPALLIGLDSSSTFSNMETAELYFLKYTLMPMMRRVEQELNLKLIVPVGGETLMFRYDVNEIMRGDAKQRSQFYHTLIQDGVLTINEARAREGLNKFNIPEADVPRVQVNSISLDRFGEYSEKISNQND
jgi:HK97 family phage portal protein